MRSLAVVLALGLLVAGCGRYGAPIRQRPAPVAVSALPDRTAEADSDTDTDAEAEACEEPEQKP